MFRDTCTCLRFDEGKWIPNPDVWQVLNGPRDPSAYFHISITTFNRPQILAASLETLREQLSGVAPNDVQVWIGDDGDDAETPAVVQALAKSFPSRILYHRHAHNVGGDQNLWSIYCALPQGWIWAVGNRHAFVSPIAPLIEFLRSMGSGFVPLNCWTGDYESMMRRPAYSAEDMKGPPLNEVVAHTMMTSLAGAAVYKRPDDHNHVHVEAEDFGAYFINVRYYMPALERGPVGFWPHPMRAATLDRHSPIHWPLDQVAEGPMRAMRGYEHLISFSPKAFNGFDTAVHSLILDRVGLTWLSRRPDLRKLYLWGLRTHGWGAVPKLTALTAALATPGTILRGLAALKILAKHRSISRVAKFMEYTRGVDKARRTGPRRDNSISPVR